MNERRNQKVVEQLFEALQNKDMNLLDKVLDEDFNLESYGEVSEDSPPTYVTPRRTLATDNVVVADVVWHFGYRQERAVSIFELRNGKIYKQTDHFGEPLDTGEPATAEPEAQSREESNRRVVENYWKALADEDLQSVYALRHEDYIAEWPQSGERVRGRDNARAIEESYKGVGHFKERRIVGAGDFWIVEATLEHENLTSHVVSILELQGGRIYKETDYFGDPFEAPKWRARFIELMR